MEKPFRVDSRNRITSSPVLNRGTPETNDVNSPYRPPNSRTVIRPPMLGCRLCDASPRPPPLFQISSMSNDVTVQISPSSHITVFPAHRARTMSSAACAIRCSDIRSIVVAPAAIAHAAASQAHNPNRHPRWVLISLHL
jgi:hypothetical protein